MLNQILEKLPRRSFLRTSTVAATLPLLGLRETFAAPALPQSVAELWADFDPRRDPIETEVIREWKEDGGVFRYVRYLIGTFKGEPARMAAIYGFPDGAKKLPAVLQIQDRKSTRLNSSHVSESRMPSSA